MKQKLEKILVDLNTGKYLDNGGTDGALKDVIAIFLDSLPDEKEVPKVKFEQSDEYIRKVVYGLEAMGHNYVIRTIKSKWSEE